MANDNENQGGQQGGRGFAGMSEERRREIASKGGKAAHQSGNANEFDSETGREAGRKGGQSRNGEGM
jgi:general stress protein YciG